MSAEATFAALADVLGHRFRDLDLLHEALTHPSSVQAGRKPVRTYQRLEFLGDRVLALVIAEMLLEAFPQEPEGALSRRLTQLVRAETCADVAIELGLGGFLRLGDGEDQSGGRHKTAILGDVCEAVIGAIFRDGGFEAARRFVRTRWHPRMLVPANDLRDAKTTLQEWAQARGHGTPVYRMRERAGPDHSPLFVMNVEVRGVGAAEGRGPSKRAAEQAAAEIMLARQIAEGERRG